MTKLVASVWRRLPVLIVLSALAVALIPGPSMRPALSVNVCDTAPCAVVVVVVVGDGTGDVSSTDTYGGAPDGFIACHVTGGTKTGSCSHGYIFHPGDPPITKYLEYIAAGGSKICGQPGNWGSTQYWQGTYSAAGTYPASYWGFCLVDPQSLGVTLSGAGSGLVTSNPAGINCAPSCIASFANYSVVTLTAAAAPGAVFGAWTGGCVGQLITCDVSMPASAWVDARFDLASAATPAPTKTPAPTNTSAPLATPVPTKRATPTPASSSPGSPSPSVGPAVGASESPASSDQGIPSPLESSAPTSGTATPGSPQPTGSGQTGAGDSGGGIPPIVMGGGLLLMAGIGAAGFLLGRRGRAGRA